METGDVQRPEISANADLCDAAMRGDVGGCRSARGRGATCYNCMLCSAARGGSAECCALAIVWGADRIDWMRAGARRDATLQHLAERWTVAHRDPKHFHPHHYWI